MQTIMLHPRISKSDWAMQSKETSQALNGQKKQAPVCCLVCKMTSRIPLRLLPMFLRRSLRSSSARQSKNCWMALFRISVAKNISLSCWQLRFVTLNIESSVWQKCIPDLLPMRLGLQLLPITNRTPPVRLLR